MGRLSCIFVIVGIFSVSGDAFADSPADQELPQLPALGVLPPEGQASTLPAPAPRMNVETISNQASRTAGWVILGGSLAVATGLFVGSLSRSEACESVLSEPATPHCQRQVSADPVYVLGAFAVAAVGGTIGLVLITREDEKKVTLTLGAPSVSYSTSPWAMVPSGLLLRGGF